jgi:hypothetical protein
LSCSKSKEINKDVFIKTETKSKGILDCKQTSFYAGKIKPGQPIAHNFSFRNKGTEPVIILEKTMSCNCTHLETSLDTIQPNETTYLNVKIDTKDKKPGKGEATITLKTDGSRKFYLLEVTFDIIE